MALSTNTYIYAGGAKLFAVNFALGFIQRSDVSVRVNGAVDGAGDPVYTAFDWVDDANILVTAALTTGDSVLIERTVSKTELKVNFAANADVTPSNLDLSAKHGLMLYQELVDGRVEGVESPITAADRAVAAAAAASASATSIAGIESAVTADLALTNADVLLTHADVVLTHADVVLTNADVVSTNADVVSTAADAAATALDKIATNADVVLTNADVVSTNADVLLTAADVVSTNADVVLTNADVVSAAASLASFTGQYTSSVTEPVAPTLGDLWFDETSGDMKVYNGTNFILAGSAVNGIDQSVEYTATASQTTFAAVYDVGFVQVYLNGILLDAADYTATNGSSVVLAVGATLSDTVFVQSFSAFTLADHYTKAEANTLLDAKLDDTQVGTGANQLVALDGTAKLPAVDGSQLTGLVGGGPSLGTSSVIRTNAQTISENITFAGTENGSSVGPITVAATFTVTVTNGSTWVIL